MVATDTHTKTSSSRGPEFRSRKESQRFIRTLVWVVVIGVMFVVGQGLRYHFKRAQISEIRNETNKLYMSVLGEDIGGSPFGRLQFEYGKLSATRRIGLDPLSVLASLSGPAMESVRLEGLTLTGKRGRVRGFFGPNVEKFESYINALSDDDRFFFSLEKREDVFGGLTFSLIVEPK